MKLTALIPAYNDAYTLRLCLASIVAHFDEIIVMDDASTDETPDVVLHHVHHVNHVRYVRHEGRQLGWIAARNMLAGLTDSQHLFWLDADDVLCEYTAERLGALAASPIAHCNLDLCEMWGDFYHTTQRLRHHDRCHFYMNRRLTGDVTWSGGTCARPTFSGTPGRLARHIPSISSIKSMPSPLFFHLKGVKPDRRIVTRGRIRAYLRDAAREDNIEARMAGMSDDEIHRLALHTLFHSRQDRLCATYSTCLPKAERMSECVRRSVLFDPLNAPRRPEVVEADFPGRFQIIYAASGQPIDRLDAEAP